VSSDYDKIGKINLLFIIDFFELLVAAFTIYRLHVFALCLSRGIIREYNPLAKFYWLAFLVVVIVMQNNAIGITWELAGKNSKENNDPIILNSLLVGVELVIGSIGFHKHFGLVPSSD